MVFSNQHSHSLCQDNFISHVALHVFTGWVDGITSHNTNLPESHVPLTRRVFRRFDPPPPPPAAHFLGEPDRTPLPPASLSRELSANLTHGKVAVLSCRPAVGLVPRVRFSGGAE